MHLKLEVFASEELAFEYLDEIMEFKFADWRGGKYTTIAEVHRIFGNKAAYKFINEFLAEFERLGMAYLETPKDGIAFATLMSLKPNEFTPHIAIHGKIRIFSPRCVLALLLAAKDNGDERAELGFPKTAIGNTFLKILFENLNLDSDKKRMVQSHGSGIYVAAIVWEQDQVTTLSAYNSTTAEGVMLRLPMLMTLRDAEAQALALGVKSFPGVPQVYTDSHEAFNFWLNASNQSKKPLPKGGLTTVEYAPIQPVLAAGAQVEIIDKRQNNITDALCRFSSRNKYSGQAIVSIENGEIIVATLEKPKLMQPPKSSENNSLESIISRLEAEKNAIDGELEALRRRIVEYETRSKQVDEALLNLMMAKESLNAIGFLNNVLSLAT